MQQHSEHGERGDPSHSDDQPAARAPPRSPRLHHEREFTIGRLSQIALHPAALTDLRVGTETGASTHRHFAKMSSILPSSVKSRSLMPLTSCVFRSITTLFHTLNHSG